MFLLAFNMFRHVLDLVGMERLVRCSWKSRSASRTRRPCGVVAGFLRSWSHEWCEVCTFDRRVFALDFFQASWVTGLESRSCDSRRKRGGLWPWQIAVQLKFVLLYFGFKVRQDRQEVWNIDLDIPWLIWLICMLKHGNFWGYAGSGGNQFIGIIGIHRCFFVGKPCIGQAKQGAQLDVPKLSTRLSAAMKGGLYQEQHKKSASESVWYDFTCRFQFFAKFCLSPNRRDQQDLHDQQDQHDLKRRGLENFKQLTKKRPR